MSLTLRIGTSDDAVVCGTICHRAFTAIADRHSFPTDFPSAEFGVEVLSHLLAHPGFYAVVAEDDGKIVGSNFLDERSRIAGLGPITVEPTAQNKQVGLLLMKHALDRATERGFDGVRLVQVAYHHRSLCLYAKLGFEVREPLVAIQGTPLMKEIPGHAVESATEADLDACNRLCLAVHGHDRGGELLDAIKQRTAAVVRRDGLITGYTTQLAYFGHTVGETNDDVKALIAAAPAFGGPGFLLPSRNGDIFRWCMKNNLRVVHAMTLMSVGMYNEPAGAYLPSILY